MMKFALEFLRILVIVFIIGAVGMSIIVYVYQLYGISENYYWMSGIAVLLLLFVLYRNKWQFLGWYQAEKDEKLTIPISIVLVSSSILLIVLPFILTAVVK